MRRFGPMAIRRWLVLALVITFVVPAMVTVAVASIQFGATWRAHGEAPQILSRGASRWNDRSWQAATRNTLSAQGVNFVLTENGKEVYRSVADPLAGADANYQVSVQRLVISNSGPRRVATIYSNYSAWRTGAAGAFWLVPIVGLAALLLTLGAIGWFLGRTLLKPLAATSDAARQIAAGDLAIRLPTSRVGEVANLNAAFMAMSTELRATLEHQARIEEERRMFVSAIAHDLRTPLFSLRGYLEGLDKGLATTPRKFAQYVAVCREKADMLERLIADLFAYTRMEYAEPELHRESLELGVLLSRVVEGRRRDAETNDVELALDGPLHGCVVEGDPYLLGRAVENLLDNALRYTSSGGGVEVRWSAGDGRATFTVADTGPGIASHDLPHLFEPLYRADPSRSRESGGTGLGLTIARGILRAHGGDLAAANRVGGGAEFTGSLPVHFGQSMPEVSSSRIAEDALSSSVAERSW